ncbi:MAG: hypothetical protein IT167_00800 [Bryobacterales bacterium]|nr:hypothetical protein [Bryobacterales bacterium]
MSLPLATQYAKSPSEAEAIYVATDLGFWKTNSPSSFCRDVQINDTAYRRLDPEYFAWLRSKLALVKEALGAGRIDRGAYDELCDRFQQVEAWALHHFGPQAIIVAIRTSEPRVYVPPRGEADSDRLDPPARDDQRIKRAIRLVDGIRDNALDLGWSLDRLYKHDGYHKRPLATDYGLVCYVGLRDRIGEVTRQAIEIVGPPPREHRSRFYNPDVDQPWIKRISREKS